MANSKRIIQPFKLWDAASLGGTLTSNAVDISYLDRVNLEITSTTSNAVGTFTVQGSITGTNWTDLAMDAMTLASANKTIFIDMQQTAIKQIRLVYTRTSGTGTVTAYVTAKEA